MEYKEHISYPGFGWIEPIQDQDCPLVAEETAHAFIAYCEDLRQQLAAALAACELQHKALINTVAHLSAATSAYEKFVGRHGTRGRADALFSTRYADFISAEKRGREALAIKPDASALKQHDEALIERCAAMCDRRTKTVSNGNGICYRSHDPASVTAEYCATAIREMKGTL